MTEIKVDLQKQAVNGDFLNYSVEASDLRLPPGRWPESIRLTGVVQGNGRPLFPRRFKDGYTVYEQQFGIITLTVFND